MENWLKKCSATVSGCISILELKLFMPKERSIMLEFCCVIERLSKRLVGKSIVNSLKNVQRMCIDHRSTKNVPLMVLTIDNTWKTIRYNDVVNTHSFDRSLSKMKVISNDFLSMYGQP